VNPALRSPAGWPRLLELGLLAAGLLAGLAACESGRPGPSPEAREHGAESAANAIPRMEARATFFSGQVEAEILLARADARWRRPEDSNQPAGRRDGGGSSGRVGGFGSGGHGGHRGGGGRGGPPPNDGAGDEQARAPIHASNLPGAALRLRLTNHGGEAVDVEVLDFDSSLGDFVVEPPRITLPPGKPIEAEPMVSRLGVGTGEIPLTIRLRLNGRNEQQVLTLRTVSEPAPAPAPPTAPAAGTAPG